MQNNQLGLKIRGNSDNALGSLSGLLADNVVAALAVNIDTVHFFGVDDVSQGSGDGFFLVEASAPAGFLNVCCLLVYQNKERGVLFVKRVR